MVVGPAGSLVFVTGYSTTGPDMPVPFDSDYITQAYRATSGRTLWTARYDGPDQSDDGATSIGISPSGNEVFVTGTSARGSYSDIATVGYDAASGKSIWKSRYQGPPGEDESASALAVSPDGSTVYVTGLSIGVTSVEYLTVAFAASDGAQLWVARYSGPGPGGGGGAASIAANPDGSAVYVTGLSAGPSSPDYATVAYDAATGSELWHSTYDGPARASDGATFVAVSPDGAHIYVTGESAASNLLFDYATVAYDAASGAQEWVSRYNGPGNRDDIPWQLAIDPTGSRLYVTGESVGAGANFDYATIAYDTSTGTRLWRTRYDGPQSGDDIASSIAVSPSGNRVYVGGTGVFVPLSVDYASIAYGATDGSRRWVARYDGPANGHEELNALAVNPNGTTVYVTGGSCGRRVDAFGPGDYATIAYRS